MNPCAELRCVSSVSCSLAWKLLHSTLFPWYTEARVWLEVRPGYKSDVQEEGIQSECLNLNFILLFYLLFPILGIQILGPVLMLSSEILAQGCCLASYIVKTYEC